MSTISSFVVELRFQPSSTILDKRGEIAGAMVSESLPVWTIENDKIQLSNPDNSKFKGLITHQSIIFTANEATSDEFKEEARKFLDKAWRFYPKELGYRLGVRSRFLDKNEEDTFEESVSRFTNKFVKISESQLAELDASIEDIALPPLDLKVGDDLMKIRSGPMKKKQAVEEFIQNENNEIDIPEVGIFVDVDYFNQQNDILFRKQSVIDFIGKGVNKAIEVKGHISDWLFPHPTDVQQ